MKNKFIYVYYMEPVIAKPETSNPQLGSESQGEKGYSGYNVNTKPVVYADRISGLSFSEKDKFKIKHFPRPVFKPEDCKSLKLSYEQIYKRSALAGQSGYQTDTKLNDSMAERMPKGIKIKKDKAGKKILEFDDLNKSRAMYRYGFSDVANQPNEYHSRGRQLVRPIIGDTMAGYNDGGYNMTELPSTNKQGDYLRPTPKIDLISKGVTGTASLPQL